MLKNIKKVRKLIGQRMPADLIDFEDPELIDKTSHFAFEMQSEEEIELNYNRKYLMEQRRFRDRYNDHDENEDDESEEDEEDLDIGDYDSPVLATLYLTVYADKDGNFTRYEVSKAVDCDGSISSGTPSDREINDVLELFLECYEEDEQG